MELDTGELRERQHKVWTSGDWPELAPTIQDVADQLVAEAEISDGADLLDVGTGSGNVAIPAAEKGAKVTGVDISPEFFDAAGKRAEDKGVEVGWVEGAAGELPFEDESFDRVLSVFGAMFDPDHEGTAAELVRVTRPGGLIANCAWTPEGANGRMFATIGQYMPPPPEGFQPPPLWGDEDHVTKLFEGKGVELQFERKMASLQDPTHQFATGGEWLSHAEDTLGPLVMAKAALSEDGKWEELRAKLLELYSEGDTPDGYKPDAEYLRVIARKS
jgi:SAM-dependent methyltransferase